MKLEAMDVSNQTPEAEVKATIDQLMETGTTSNVAVLARIDYKNKEAGMVSTKLKAGGSFPAITVPKLGGGELTLGTPNKPYDWRLVLVYRGKHCPICTRYLSEVNAALPELKKIAIDVIAVSADSEEKAAKQIGEVKPDFDVGYDLSIKQMQALGLYISNPRSAHETDRPFAEPGLFVINSDGAVQVTDISNAPFARPDLKSLIMGLGFIRNPENNYPVRGTHE